jgi:hypothetical protein
MFCSSNLISDDACAALLYTLAALWNTRRPPAVAVGCCQTLEAGLCHQMCRGHACRD